MIKKAISLPEKHFFAVEEVAERWGCSCDLVSHYLSEGWLRLALDTKHFPSCLDMLDLEATLKLARDANVNWTDIFHHPLAEQSHHTVPRFLYLNHNDDRKFSQVEDFSRRKYFLVETDTRRNSMYFTYDLVSMTADEYGPPVISREELDRFERTLGAHEAENPDQPHAIYTTPYMRVLSEAVTKFFEPRQKVDAKRAEIESWIAARLEAAGVEGSMRIASAMFTIIKPSDHNPRKRRG